MAWRCRVVRSLEPSQYLRVDVFGIVNADAMGDILLVSSEIARSIAETGIARAGARPASRAHPKR